MTQQQLTFPGSDGVELAAVLDLPEGTPASFAVFAHCFTCGKDSHAATRISRQLTHRGIAVLRYDFAGLGDSGGEFADATFTSGVDDLVAAAAWLRDTHRAPSLLVGHSLGGAAVLAAASRLPEVTAVATLAAPADPAHIARLFDGAAGELSADGEARVRIGERELTIRRELMDDLAEQRQSNRIAELGAALLVLHSPQDETVPLADAGAIYQAARHPKSFVALDGADHLLSDRVDSRYAADVIATWASRYLDVAEEGRPDAAVTTDDDPDEVRPGVVVVSETGEGPFSQVVRSGRHTWTADEPLSVKGGTDTGPSPYDLVLAGLGACTAMTLRMYAGRKGWDLGRVTVTVRRDRLHAEDAALCLEDGGSTCSDGFVREVHVEGRLEPAQRERLAEIADKCPVHRTIEQGVRVVTTVV